MNRIKEELDKKGIKQILVVEKLGKGYNIANTNAHNRRQPRLEDLYKIAEILDVKFKTISDASRN